MNGEVHPALLPAGMVDMLPPDAEFESRVIEGLMRSFGLYGYERVKPPLIEFEESLTGGSAAATASQTFRLMDPVSQRMLGIRADMTLQIARIAMTRLKDLARPLRLSYAGQVLRIKGSELRPERQFGQVGAELIGASSPGADAEVILMATQSLKKLGVADLSVDLGMPTLISLICDDLGIERTTTGRELMSALNQKDAAAIADFGGDAAEVFGAMLKAAGPAEKALAALRRLNLSKNVEVECQFLEQVVAIVRETAPDLNLTVDPIEMRGYEYHVGVTFTLFAPNVRGELGRGGRYMTGNANGDSEREPATGFTLFIDSLLRALPRSTPENRLLVPSGAAGEAGKLRDDGWIVIESLGSTEVGAAEAERLRCTHIFLDNQIIPVE